MLTCLRSRTRDQILNALPIGMDQIVEGARVQWGPVVDGWELPDQPRALFEGGAFAHVPLLLGTNRDEGWLFVERSFTGEVTEAEYDRTLANEFGFAAPDVQSFYAAAFDAVADPALQRKQTLAQIVGDAEYTCEARRVARAVERTGTPVFLYSFDYPIEAVAGDRAIHGLEVNLLFGNGFGAPSNYALDDADRNLFRAMAGYWTRFASHGHPDAIDESSVHWPRFKHPSGQGRGAGKHLVLDATIRDGMRLREAACDFWEGYYLRSMTGAITASAP
jgi:para-nitrobenzyl esterase